MSPPQQLRQRTSSCSALLIYRPRKDERLSWPSWLTYSGWSTHISGHPSATGRAQDSKSTPANDRRSTAGPRNQQRSKYCYVSLCILKTIVWTSRNFLYTLTVVVAWSSSDDSACTSVLWTSCFHIMCHMVIMVLCCSK